MSSSIGEFGSSSGAPKFGGSQFSSFRS
jgi:hypothetical protein